MHRGQGAPVWRRTYVAWEHQLHPKINHTCQYRNSVSPEWISIPEESTSCLLNYLHVLVSILRMHLLWVFWDLIRSPNLLPEPIHLSQAGQGPCWDPLADWWQASPGSFLMPPVWLGLALKAFLIGIFHSNTSWNPSSVPTWGCPLPVPVPPADQCPYAEMLSLKVVVAYLESGLQVQNS